LAGTAESGVHVTNLEVPRHVARGDTVQLRCLWDLNSFNLYSVKWYRDDMEFFRFIPSEDMKMSLSLPGVKVDEQNSDGELVVLQDVDLNTGGRFKCEVLSGFPEFYTADKSAEMIVVELPEEKPTIHGTQHEYHIGDTARLTCVSALSRPAAELTWEINSEKVPPQYLVPMSSIKYQSGLEQTRLGLEFEVTRKHFVNSEMTLRCSAKISSIYFKTQQHSVDGQLTYNVPVMESRDISAFSAGSVATQRPSMLLLMLLPLLLMVAPVLMTGQLDLVVR
ncbi:uncharacterized protein LOC122257801, partial [Penaeus japonicus]|uniref:uncharacterized protein LOC122257801 n=1 Tax=Penaeus japonicus TaxID=27405 RepID=UPI001C7156F2